MFYTYVLISTRDEKIYTGYTKNLKLRFEKHQRGKIKSTKDRRPLKLIYYSPSEMLQEAIPMHRDYFTG
ncbi:MAG: GIY-YIG nuclease family protein [Candidatus Cloacimonetes bacterium]|nr:GIY-YIG nuclease family protein [Candidatus Cloacimonadota bacterium]